MPPPDVPVPRQQLGQALKALRDKAKVSRAHAASVIDCAESKIGHLENGITSITRLELEALLRLYKVPTERHEALEVLREKAKQRRSKGSYRLPRWLRQYLDLESDASTIRSFEGELIPGLLQTEEYALRVHAVARHLVTPDEVERFVAARIERQQRLAGDNALSLDFIVSEAAFRRLLGDREVAPGQLAHLIEILKRPNVSLRVIPFDSEPGEPDPHAGGLHPSMSGSFAVLSFEGDVAAPFGYLENAIGGSMVVDQKVIEQLGELWELLRDQALSCDESLEWLRELSRKAGR